MPLPVPTEARIDKCCPVELLAAAARNFCSSSQSKSETPGFIRLGDRFSLATLTKEERAEWEAAVAQAEAEGTFFIATPHHCAVGIKPP